MYRCVIIPRPVLSAWLSPGSPSYSTSPPEAKNNAAQHWTVVRASFLAHPMLSIAVAPLKPTSFIILTYLSPHSKFQERPSIFCHHSMENETGWLEHRTLRARYLYSWQSTALDCSTRVLLTLSTAPIKFLDSSTTSRWRIHFSDVAWSWHFTTLKIRGINSSCKESVVVLHVPYL